jgi:glucose-1-phosphate thymidylyltransferase
MNEIVGLVPAAGHAKRMSPLPCSKELYPIGFRAAPVGQSRRPKAACQYLLDQMRAAGICKAYIVLREGKWDIPTYLSDGRMVDMDIAYLMAHQSFGVPYTLDQAYPFVQDVIVAFGFPDILFHGDRVFDSLLRHQATSHADIVLGLFPVYENQKTDRVDFDASGVVREIIIPPRETRLQFSWDVTMWTPVFTSFLHDYLSQRKVSAATEPELSVGHVIQAAIENGLRVNAIPVSDEPFLDIGTPEGLTLALKRFLLDDCSATQSRTESGSFAQLRDEVQV